MNKQQPRQQPSPCGSSAYTYRQHLYGDPSAVKREHSCACVPCEPKPIDRTYFDALDLERRRKGVV